MDRFSLAYWVLIALSAVCPAGAQTLPPPVLIRTTYISVVGADTVWQNVLRTPQSFQSDILIPAARASVKVMALLDQRALIRKLDLDVWRAIGTPGQVHAQSASFVVTDDSVLGEVRAADRRQPQRFPSPTGAMIVQGNYLGFLEQLVLRARALGVTDASIPLFFFGTPGDTGIATVRFPHGSDSAIVTIRNRSTELRVNDLGRILSGKNGSSVVSRVKFRAIFPTDSAPAIRCGTANRAARRSLSQPALAAVFAYYKVAAADVAAARALNDETDINACRDMLTLFQIRTEGPAIGQSLFKVGNLYVAIAGIDATQAGVAIVYDDNLEVAHMVSLGTPKAH